MEFFKEKQSKEREQKQLLKATIPPNVSAQAALFLAANLTAKAKRCSLLLVNSWCRLLPRGFVVNFQQSLQFKKRHVFLLASTITGQTDETARGHRSTMVSEDGAPWCTQSRLTHADVDSGQTILLVFVRCIFQEDAQRDMLYVLLLQTNTTATEWFKSFKWSRIRKTELIISFFNCF